MEWFRRLGRTTAYAALALAVASCGEDGSDPQAATQADLTPQPLIARIVSNGDTTSGLPIRFEQLDSNRLAELRSQEHLDDVVAGAADEFETMLRLKDWVAAQWPDGTPDPYPPWDGLVVLDWIRTGKTGGFCAQYAQLLLQSLAAFGYQARYIEIGSMDNPYAHFLIEAWSNQYDKWIVLDPDFNVHFERDGIPLSALEVHDALVDDEAAEVTVVGGSYLPPTEALARFPLQTIGLYYYLRAHHKADHLSMPDEAPFDRFNDMTEWQDERAVMWEDSVVESTFPKARLTNLRSSDRATFAGKLNQVVATIESTTPAESALRLENNVVQFRKYQYRQLFLPNDEAAWVDHEGDTFVWKPTKTTRVLQIRGVNASGVAGPPITLSARLPSPRS